MSTSTLTRLLDSVEWGPIGTYTTNKGKSKVCRKGIPKANFWRRWKANKSELSKLGLTVAFTDIEKVYSRKNGKITNKKLWEITAWDCSIFQ